MAQVIILGPGSRAGAYSKVARYHLNATRGGRGTTARVGLNYARYAFEKNRRAQQREADEEQEGEAGGGLGQNGWRSPIGETDYTEVRNWIKAGSRTHKYTVKMVLSAEMGVRLSADEWQAIMGGDRGFLDWRLIPHRDTHNDHAHVVAFADRYMRRDEFLDWRKSVVERIQEIEQHSLLDRGRTTSKNMMDGYAIP